ncbi:lipoate--protein ligase [Clostridium sp. DL1XJH146]
MKYIINRSNNPYYNLAFEEYCFKKLEEDEIVFLWKNSPTVVIGKNQNTLEEINEEYINANDIKVVRRITGGGAVYHDLGNLNFTFIKKVDNIEELDLKKYASPIVSALEKFGVKAELSGRNDITVDSKKISGNSQSIYKNKVLHHGTMLIDSDLSVLSKALKVKKEKFESKGVKSVRSRVTNIRPYLNYDFSIEEFEEELINQLFIQEKEEKKELVLSAYDLENIKELYESKYSTWEWNYGFSPIFNYKNIKRCTAGTVEFNVDVRDGYIKKVRIFGDFFGNKDINELEEILIDTKFMKEDILLKLDHIDLSNYILHMALDDFIACMFE